MLGRAWPGFMPQQRRRGDSKATLHPGSPTRPFLGWCSAQDAFPPSLLSHPFRTWPYFPHFFKSRIYCLLQKSFVDTPAELTVIPSKYVCPCTSFYQSICGGVCLNDPQAGLSLYTSVYIYLHLYTTSSLPAHRCPTEVHSLLTYLFPGFV